MTVMLVWNLNTTISNKAVVVGTFGLRLGYVPYDERTTYGLMVKSCNEARLTGMQNSCRLNRRSSSWAPLEQAALLLHKLTLLLFVVEWHPSAILHDLPMRLLYAKDMLLDFVNASGSLIIAIGFRIGTFDATGRAADPTLQDDLFIVWTQTELNYSLISATIPTIQSFVNNLNTQFGGIGTSGSGRGYGSGYGLETGPGNYQLSNLKSVDKSEGREAFVPSQQGTGVNAEPKYGIWVAGNAPKGNHVPAKRTKGGGDATSVDSNDSRQMIIQKDVTWEVHMEDHC